MTRVRHRADAAMHTEMKWLHVHVGTLTSGAANCSASAMCLTTTSSLGWGSGWLTNMENGSNACDQVFAAPDTRLCRAIAKIRAIRSGLLRFSFLQLIGYLRGQKKESM